MADPFRNYDAWKLSYPPAWDEEPGETEQEDETCTGCRSKYCVDCEEARLYARGEDF